MFRDGNQNPIIMNWCVVAIIIIGLTVTLVIILLWSVIVSGKKIQLLDADDVDEIEKLGNEWKDV